MLLVGLSAGGVSSKVLQAQDWPQWRGPNRNGQTSKQEAWTSTTTFEQVWKQNVGTGFSSVVVVGDRLWTMGHIGEDDVVSCLNAETGETLWQHRYPEPLDPNLFEGGPTSTPAVAGNQVVTISRKGKVFCLNAESGEVNWQVDLVESLQLNAPTWGFAGSPLIFDDRVFLNAGSHGVCLDLGSGDVQWQSDSSEDAGYTSPLPHVVDGRAVVLLVTAKTLVAADQTSGEVCWSVPWITRYGINAADPVIVDEHQLVVSSGYSKGASLIQMTDSSAKPVWRIRELKNQMSPGVLLDGHLYALDGDAGQRTSLVCLEVEPGVVKWTEPDLGSATLILVGKQLMVLSGKGELLIVDPNPESFSLVTQSQLNSGKCWTPVSYANGMIYSRNAVGDVVCSRPVP